MLVSIKESAKYRKGHYPLTISSNVLSLFEHFLSNTLTPVESFPNPRKIPPKTAAFV